MSETSDPFGPIHGRPSFREHIDRGDVPRPRPGAGRGLRAAAHRPHARRPGDAQPGVVRHHVDGAAGREADPRHAAQEPHRPRGVPGGVADRGGLRAHAGRPVQRARLRPQVVGVATIGSSEAIMLGLLAHKRAWRDRRRGRRAADGPAERGLRRGDPRGVGQVRQLLRRRDAQDPDEGGPVRAQRATTSRRTSTRTRSPSARCWAPPTSARRTRSRRSTTSWCGSRPRRAGTSRCTSTGRAARSSPRSPSRTCAGTSASSRSRRSTRPGHKYGLVYPGVGWLIFRDASKLPEDLVFSVNYLGGAQPTYTFNFSRGSAMIQAQMYNFLRLGRSGYTSIVETMLANARFLNESLEASGTVRDPQPRAGGAGGHVLDQGRPGLRRLPPVGAAARGRLDRARRTACRPTRTRCTSCASSSGST